MEETLKVGVCQGCERRRFVVRSTQAGDETRELCVKCRRASAATEPIATLVPGLPGSLVVEPEPKLTMLSMQGEGAPGMIFSTERVTVHCGHEAAISINRYGRTRCLPCDAALPLAGAA